MRRQKPAFAGHNKAEPHSGRAVGPGHTRECVCSVGVGGGVRSRPPADRGLQGWPHTRGLLDGYSVELRGTLSLPHRSRVMTHPEVSPGHPAPGTLVRGQRQTGISPPKMKTAAPCSPLPYHHQLCRRSQTLQCPFLRSCPRLAGSQTHISALPRIHKT